MGDTIQNDDIQLTIQGQTISEENHCIFWLNHVWNFIFCFFSCVLQIFVMNIFVCDIPVGFGHLIQLVSFFETSVESFSLR